MINSAFYTKMTDFAGLYENELKENIMPFWINNSIDEEYGGFFNCLTREGDVFDTDKFMWLQAREVWTFATLYKHLEKNKTWLDIAKQGADFIKKHGRDKDGNWHFSLTRAGHPLTKPFNIFSDCFASMALGVLETELPGYGYGDIAKETFENVLKRRNSPKGIYAKQYPDTRNLKGFALPMILCNLALEIEPILGKDTVDSFIPEVLHEVMEVFYRPELGLIVENVTADGKLSDCFEGRLLNPGHAIEAMWFVMDLGKRLNDSALIQRAVDIAIQELEFGWDELEGGIFYFLDRKGAPPLQLEWDQKLWWVHLEALVAMAKGYAFTGDPRCEMWFRKIHDYTWTHFRDEDFGEWFGYLNRRGEVLLPLKGGKWKGCFHVPRGLFQIAKTLKL